MNKSANWCHEHTYIESLDQTFLDFFSYKVNQTLYAWHFHESNTGFAAIYYHSTVRLVEDVSGNLWAMLVATQSMSTRDMHETQTQCKTPKMQP